MLGRMYLKPFNSVLWNVRIMWHPAVRTFSANLMPVQAYKVHAVAAVATTATVQSVAVWVVLCIGKVSQIQDEFARAMNHVIARCGDAKESLWQVLLPVLF